MDSPSLDVLRLVTRFNLYPELDMHASWLPADWPARHRRLARLGPAGLDVVRQLVHDDEPGAHLPLYDFDSRMARLALLDSPTLRRLAAYLGLCAHQPVIRMRREGRQLRRLARCLHPQAPSFVSRRAPPLSALQMNLDTLQRRPSGIGRMVLDRGARLMLGALRDEGDVVVQRVRRKLPRRVSARPVPVLTPAQAEQLRELALLCVIPERFSEWDWLF